MQDPTTLAQAPTTQAQAPTTPVRPISTSVTTPPPAPERPAAEAMLLTQLEKAMLLVDGMRNYLHSILNGDEPDRDAASLLEQMDRVFPPGGGA